MFNLPLLWSRITRPPGSQQGLQFVYQRLEGLGARRAVANGPHRSLPASAPENPDLHANSPELIPVPGELAPPVSTLRPYQQDCITTSLSAFEAGLRRQAVSLPVGSGKTVIFSHLISQIPDRRSGANKVLILAHREELLFQASRQIGKYAPNLRVELEQGVNRASPLADVVVASAHHAAATVYLRILTHFGADSPQSEVLVWGCSATLRRHDRLTLGVAFDKITYHRDFMQMIREKWLCPIRALVVQTTTDLSKVHSLAGDFAVNELSQQVNTARRNDMVGRAWQQVAYARQSTLVFAVDVAHVQGLWAAFRAHGVAAEMVTGTTRAEDRYDMLTRFAQRKVPVMINCSILTEGTDVPAIDCIIMARPTRSAVLYQQMVGRGLRLYPDKTDCLVVDFVDVAKSKANLLTTPSLTGIEPVTTFRERPPRDASEGSPEFIDDGALEVVREHADQAAASPTGAVSFRVEAQKHPFLEWASRQQSRHDSTSRVSSLAWVQIHKGQYVLSSGPQMYVYVERTPAVIHS
ncbi:P-loop containing nucleoside triphosphate hydrolase protein [Dimargaris cristalligena]|uniref:P-loop containing nucleoside triphosphate hydrolase protein n=1 Tax=Dimargaris cristalligena TaxID=215637 RepID=A0A4V1J4V7_9FUNG|nr:P-loop containing nucleoside triphosphate hydrolase protein [Dimargaris cristalligena]|eukprot:RKP36899.1 P-loop containing nucleoside triphosphate hydrolase protein [Dimargaris cristalligena]